MSANDYLPVDWVPFDPRMLIPDVCELKCPPPDWTAEDQRALDKFLSDRRVLKKVMAKSAATPDPFDIIGYKK